MASSQANRNCGYPSIYFAKVPNFQDLCTVSLQVSSDAPGISNVSQFGSQPQIIKCRELIFTEPNVLASPSLQEQGLIFVIIQQSFWKTGKLQTRCQKSGLKISKPTRVIPAVFQACLSYTLKAKLAPLWNKAGDLYIQGRDFLITSTKANAVGVEINVTDAEICIALKPTIVKMSQSDIRDFEIAPGVFDHFFASTSNIIPEYAIEDKWCHILPSLKKGKLVSVTHQIPAVSPFKTYKDIRRYWKNAYGYRLPESDTGIIYYNIYFPAIGNTLFTYPDFCVFKREPVLLPRADPTTIIPPFLADLQSKLPSICGFPFKVNPKAQYPTTGLYQASIQNNSLSRLTLATVPPQHNYPIRQMPSQPTAGNPNTPLPHRSNLPNRALAKAFDAAFQQAGSRVQPNQTNICTNMQSHHMPAASPIAPRSGALDASPAVHRFNQLNRGHHMPASPITPQYGVADAASPGVQPNQLGRGNTSQLGARPLRTNVPSHHIPASPIAPHYGGVNTASPDVQWSQLGRGQTSHGARPVNTNLPSLQPRAILPASPPPAPAHFQRRLTYQSPPAGMSPSTHTCHQRPSQSPCAATHHTAIHHSPLMSNSAAQHPSQLYRTISSPQCIRSSNQSQQFAPHPGYASQPQVKTANPYASFQFPCSPPPQMHTPVPMHSPVAVATKIVPSFRPHKARNLSFQPQGSSQSAKVIPVFKPAAKRSITPTFAAKVQLNFDTEPKDQQSGLVRIAPAPAQLDANNDTSQQTPMKPSFGTKTPHTPVGNMLGKPVKRKAKESDSESTPKRQRAKPKVQDVDMQALMLNDQLSKVNTVTLVTWLKDKNIKVKSREKKPDLIAKVMAFINAKSKEH
ncbi:uncharacterized protein [Amphiura filiformis]|uniref:uncharacterized protein n=1 Tax=Amphiura filiformis TaxID=82378 RepID=UPI003B216FAC